MRVTRTVVLAGSLVSLAAAQSTTPAAPPSFAVASVKINDSGAAGVSAGTRPGGFFVGTNVPLRILILVAYGVRPNQIVGGPAWLESTRFDITARAPATTSDSQMLAMLRSLLADRFKLVARRELREERIYALVPANADGRLGPQLKAVTRDCSGQAATPDCRLSVSIGARSIGTMVGGAKTIAVLADALGRNSDRPIVDRTGLAGTFDFELRWRGDDLTAADAAADLPSLFTAVQEQLGLRLEPTRGPVEFIVVESAEMPSPD